MTEADAIEVARRYAWWRGWKRKVRHTPHAHLRAPAWLEKTVPNLKVDPHPTWFVYFHPPWLDGDRASFLIDDVTRQVIKNDLPSVKYHLIWAPLTFLAWLIMPLAWLIECGHNYKLPRCPGCGQKTLARNGRRCASCGWRTEKKVVS